MALRLLEDNMMYATCCIRNLLLNVSLSFSCLIAMALKNSKTGSLPVSEIYSFMKEHFPYFKVCIQLGVEHHLLCSQHISLTSFCVFQTAPDGWKNSVRHNLSLNKCFEKVENKMSGTSRKGCLWALNPAKIDKMEEEMQKWKRKDLAAIHRSMANPGRAYITLQFLVLKMSAWPGIHELKKKKTSSAKQCWLAQSSWAFQQPLP